LDVFSGEQRLVVSFLRIESREWFNHSAGYSFIHTFHSIKSRVMVPSFQMIQNVLDEERSLLT